MSNSVSASYLLEATIPDIHRLFSQGELTPADLVEFYLKRVRDHDLDATHAAPFNSIVSICPLLRQHALEVGREIASGGVSKPLHGIPIWIKDCIDVEGLPTSCGCLSLANDSADRDAVLVSRLRSAGALIMGKSGMTELSKRVSGHGSLSTLIGNAYDSASQPGGSSNGSAVATALNFGMAAVGVDDLASVTWPSAMNNLAGFRPTVGAIDRDGVFGFSGTDTTPGPMTRTMGDLVRLLDVLEGGPPQRSSSPVGLTEIRIGVLESIGDLELASRTPNSMTSAFDQRLDELEKAGATLVREVRLDGFDRGRMSQYDYHNSMVRSLRQRSRSPRTPYELLHAPGTGPLCHNVPSIQRWKFTFQIPDIRRPRYQRKIRRNQKLLHSVMKAAGVDVLIAPTIVAVSWISTLASSPHLTLPAGFRRIDDSDLVPNLTPGSDLPWGVSLLGLPGSDRALLESAFALEALFQARRMPVIHEPEVGDRPPLDIAGFNAWRLQIAEQLFSSLVFDGGEGYTHPTAEEFRVQIKPLLTGRDQ